MRHPVILPTLSLLLLFTSCSQSAPSSDDIVTTTTLITTTSTDSPATTTTIPAARSTSTTTSIESTTTAVTMPPSYRYAPSDPFSPEATPDGGGSGCSPGSGPLPDGVWFGFIDGVAPTTIEFDLACFISCEEGRGFRVANDNPATRTVAVSAGAVFASVDSDGEYWFEPFETAAFFEGLGTHWDAWIYINEGEVTHVVPTGPMGCIVATGEIDWVAELPATDLVAFNDLGLITSSSDTNRFYWGVDGWQSSDRLTGKAHALWLGRVVAASGSAVGIGTYVHEWTGSSWTTTSLDFIGDEAGALAMSKDRILMSGYSNRNAIVHVLRPSGTSWEIEDTITLGKWDDWQTWAGTIDGDTFAVSDTGQDSGHSGEVRIYQRAGSVWTLTETLTSRRDTRNFGSSLDLDGDRLVVLADGATPGPSSAGGLYLYTRSGDRWTLEVLDERGSGFGFGARIDGDTIVAAGSGSGREPTLWVYIRTTDGWRGTPIQAGSEEDWVNGVDVYGDEVAVSLSSALLVGRLR